VDEAAFFAYQHYGDFLGRMPDEAGLRFWSAEVEHCGTDAGCLAEKRVNVSAAFFLSIEFQETGYLAYRMYKAAYGNLPGAPVPVRRDEMMSDAQRLGQGVAVGIGDWSARLEANKEAYAAEFVTSARFAAAFPPTLAPAEFVARLNANTGGALTPAEADALAAELSADNTLTRRARVLRRVAENAEFGRREKNRAFVLMQYFGYLRRDPNSGPDADFGGYHFWLTKLNDHGGDFHRAEMVKAFITSGEYRARFGQ
jgi:hypothetical protein